MISRIVAATAAAIFLLPVATGCSTKTENRGDEVQADIEAAIMQGREAASVFVQSKWKDTTELQERLLEARAKQSTFTMAGKPHAAAAFDSAFVSTVRTVRPDVARELDKHPHK